MGRETIWQNHLAVSLENWSGCIVRVNCFGKDFVIFSGQIKINLQKV